MKATERESRAAHLLANAIVELFVAIDEGNAERRSRRPREEPRVKVEHPPVPPQPAEPPAQASAEFPDQLMLNSKEAMKYLGIGERQLWTLSAPRGPLPVAKFGRSVRYPIAELREAVKKFHIKPWRSPLAGWR